MMSDAPITVWLIEDDDLYRRTVGELLAEQEDLRLEADFRTCEEAFRCLETARPPEVILCDIGLPGMSGDDGARVLKSAAPLTQIIMLTIHEDERRIFDAVCAGASGYLLKSSTADQILHAVRDVRQGGVPFSAPVARKVLSFFTRSTHAHADVGLTDREREILLLMAEGSTQKDVASRLFLSPHTVDSHLRRIYAKLHVRNGLEAVSKAIRNGLI